MGGWKKQTETPGKRLCLPYNMAWPAGKGERVSHRLHPRGAFQDFRVLLKLASVMTEGKRRTLSTVLNRLLEKACPKLKLG